jgi:hypothetical protein
MSPPQPTWKQEFKHEPAAAPETTPEAPEKKEE